MIESKWIDRVAWMFIGFGVAYLMAHTFLWWQRV